MNDFTLEELEMLSHHDNMTQELHDKIQSMIDNYCEPKPNEMKIDWSKASIRDMRNE